MLRGDFPKTEQNKKALRIYLLCAIKEKFWVKRRTRNNGRGAERL